MSYWNENKGSGCFHVTEKHSVNLKVLYFMLFVLLTLTVDFLV